MENRFLNMYDACLMKRLGHTYNDSREYREAVRAEETLLDRFRKGLTEEQKKQLDDCCSAICRSAGICEQLAYRQGMRDMAALLYDK